jgi:hypothetical protein
VGLLLGESRSIAEFAALGSALTTRWRNEAEEGAQHRTARRLVALFEQLIPLTPKLVAAYGIRVSEIIQKPYVNSRGSHNHGPFKDFIGADGTAIWAAATSGVPALGVYLLACPRARAWEPPSAVSIWVELEGLEDPRGVQEPRNCLSRAWKAPAKRSPGKTLPCWTRVSVLGCGVRIKANELNRIS